MWQLIVLSALFASATTTTDVQKYYGNWTLVMQFPDPQFKPGTPCLNYVISKTKDENCPCADGKVATVIDVYIPTVNDTETYPVVYATSAAQVKEEIIVSCTCSQKQYATRVIARSINDNYFVMYSKREMDKAFYGPSEEVVASVSARNLDTAAEIEKIVKQDDLSERSGKVICSQD